MIILTDEELKIQQTKTNIEYWENEAQEQYKKGDIMGAVGCKYLADILRKEIEGKE